MKRLVLYVLALLLLCGCASPAPGSPVRAAMSDPQPAVDPDTPAYHAPEFADAVFHPEQALEEAPVRLDLSSLSDGYVAVSAVSEQRLKFQVCKDGDTYNYDLSNDGTPSVFPLQCGDGSYRFRVMENISETRYAEIFAVERTVCLHDEFQPYLRPSDLVPYQKDSACVLRAAELAADAHSAGEVVNAVYEDICSRVTYDDEKARTVQPGYLPCPDETLESGRGICFDYAALAAAMLRSQGIPTKLIFGYVSPGGLYHAWNMFYTDETGWVTVSYQKNERWNRLDLTFSANGADSEFIGDGGNYTDIFIY